MRSSAISFELAGEAHTESSVVMEAIRRCRDCEPDALQHRLGCSVLEGDVGPRGPVTTAGGVIQGEEGGSRGETAPAIAAGDPIAEPHLTWVELAQRPVEAHRPHLLTAGHHDLVERLSRRDRRGSL